MSQRSSVPARAIAAAALVCGFVLVLAVVAISLGGGDDSANGKKAGERSAKAAKGADDKSPPKAYVVQNGDTLTSIAHRTGVSVARIQELNPGVDPQILVSGEKLKLR